MAQEERGPARGRAHGGSRRGRGDEGADEIASPRKVGPSAARRRNGTADQRDPRADPTSAQPPAEIDLPGGGATAAEAGA